MPIESIRLDLVPGEYATSSPNTIGNKSFVVFLFILAEIYV